ncbi:MAG: DUF1580 domain-containing protein [Planctomycetes bacterium]|nr:DUF1580 domain-containing protein [Planctomycetota bacterium]
MFANEDKLTLSQAAETLPKKLHPSAIWRWCRKGIRTAGAGGTRVRLEHVRLGGRIYTSAEAISRFSQAVADDDLKHFVDDPSQNTTLIAPTAAQREKEIADADKRLAAAGI